MKSLLRTRRTPVLIGAIFMFGGFATAMGDVLDDQRAAFREVYPAAERGDWEPVREKESLLRQYVLWPDLKAAWLRAHLDDAAVEVRQFLDEYGTSKPARELRYQFALRLAAKEHFPEYLELYRRWYESLDIAKLDCLALQAGILGGGNDRVASRGRELWLTGRSQADECDPVFDYLRGAGRLDEQLYRQRFELAVGERQFSLARYLARSLDERYLDEANAWIAAQNTPDEFLRSADLDGTDRQQLMYAIERLTYDDAELASEHWQRLRTKQQFSALQTAGISRHIALWLARQHRPAAFDSLRALPSEAVDIEVRRWLVRSALRQRSFKDAIAAIEEMPEDERQTEEWQYWLAISGTETGKDEEAKTILASLAEERSYYGFLAADELGSDYAWAHAALHEDRESLGRLAQYPSLVRARELYYVGLESRGRSEWDDAVSTLLPEEKVQAALLAHSWGWHSRAIATLASVEDYDDLEVRYPLPFREQFEKHSETAEIPYSWAYGVARSESLFMTDIRSIAGAVGVMQLMPETGRRTASEMKLPYGGVTTLTDPDRNIQLGTFYLGKMLRRFGHNPILATAAYNAGPLRVEKWLPEADRLDARIWIESIPFNETRGYVRRVLFTDAIFHWRLTGETRRLSESLAAIDPSPPPRQLANAERERIDGS
jgi:soluble lytic murein transglycosylase